MIARCGPTKQSVRDLVICLAAAVLASVALCAYRPENFRPEEAALGAETRPATEVWDGIPITLTSIEMLRTNEPLLVSERHRNPGRPMAVWLGNSQLHTINQYARGDHLAPYWLAKALSASCPVLPLGLSLPNASLQEHLIMGRWALDRLPADIVVLPVVFDDLRETGLRDEFSLLLHADLRRTLEKDETSRVLLERFGQEKASGEAPSHDPLADFVHGPVEQWFDKSFSAVVPLWKDRAALRAQILLHLYHSRNALFGIKSSTVRRMIPQRKELNERALKALLGAASSRGVPLVLYVAPIRHDVPIPYDEREYRQFIVDLEDLAGRFGATFLNLEALVPAGEWGHYQGDNIDFMHFRGSGHRRLADAIAPVVSQALGCR